jgi:hypothetical protein
MEEVFDSSSQLSMCAKLLRYHLLYSSSNSVGCQYSFGCMCAPAQERHGPLGNFVSLSLSLSLCAKDHQGFHLKHLATRASLST